MRSCSTCSNRVPVLSGRAPRSGPFSLYRCGGDPGQRKNVVWRGIDPPHFAERDCMAWREDRIQEGGCDAVGAVFSEAARR